MPLRSFVLLAAVLLVATARRPLHRVPRGAPSTGSYIVVLRDGTSEKSFEQLQRAATDASEEAPVVTRTVGKTITAKLTPEMLEEVCDRSIMCMYLLFYYLLIIFTVIFTSCTKVNGFLVAGSWHLPVQYTSYMGFSNGNFRPV